ncbi:MAG: PorP/SprF family type IX secretion system membrane protein [Saprospiraceae bacterium]|uniref:PorP/SprF family type IX secretion system membrane protein n=1 Tax=Candidatus Opimibacter skivensis TaxID=2982028 RepID=A0A9D7SRE4_9BACT|nr:PorP/SprF family type IX secretion system membrane protein [Candidatus Opimibacter skivensis]
MRTKLRYFFLGIFLMMMHWSVAQRVMQNSLYMFDRYAFNPAFGGMESSLVANLLYRTQWAGIPGNPETYMINAHMPFYLWHGAVGLELFNESIGAENQTAFLISYNYIRETPIGLFSLGLKAGMTQNSLDGTKLRTPDGFYEGGIIDHQDINLPNGAISGISPLFETGVYYAGDYFEAGLSMTGVYPGGISLGEGIHASPKPGFHFFGEYFIETFDQVSIYPVVYIKSDLVETQAELSVRAEWENIATAGIGYRGFGNNNLDALILTAGVRLSPKFYLNYAYDIGLSSLNSAHQGTHEILIRYNLGKMIGAGLPPRTIYNPRNL